ncbi:DUF732 domain-containing protein [Nocardia tengchongensis]|uniref:DUF732 domain-containing protein n=1 Tax=Nocardia tengchongensis TaxID=2055889 RepID=UPI0036A00103
MARLQRPAYNQQVLLIVLAVIGFPVLFCGGCFAFIGDSASSSSHTSATSTSTHPVAPVYTSADTPPPTTTKKAFTDEEAADAAYILTLDTRGIHYSTNAAAITLAHTVCDALREGAGTYDAAVAIAANSPCRLPEAGYITSAAIGTYCPEFK